MKARYKVGDLIVYSNMTMLVTKIDENTMTCPIYTMLILSRTYLNVRQWFSVDVDLNSTKIA
jgi:hypothetical protein